MIKNITKPVLLTLLHSFLSAGLISPENNSVLNYIHVMFEWEQIPEASAYQIQVSANSDFSNAVIDEIDSSLVFIDKNNLEWESGYFWRVRPLYADGTSGDWSASITFTTGEKQSSATSTFHDTNHIAEGITIFGSFFNYFSAAIDGSGNEIWNSGDNNLIYYHTSEDGDRFGCYYVHGGENNIPAVEFDVDTEYIWEEPNEEFVHHEFIKLPNGNYMGIVSATQAGPIAVGSWTPQFQALGYVADGVTPEFTWVGDKIVEWDKDTKVVVWSWNVFEHFSMADFDDKGGTWDQAFIDLQYDWTHANALAFSEEENAVYLSVRHLSRITKIDYATGNVVWNLGHEMPSGDVSMGTEIGFSFQHGIQVLDNGNIVTFDNGNLSEIFLNTSEPTSRALEISILAQDSSFFATTVWEYVLDESLFGFASGNVQKLDSENYLITTVGGGGTTLEVDTSGNILWEADYNLSLPNGAVYRANRIPGIFPSAFSVIVNDLRDHEGEKSIVVTETNPDFSFRIENESQYDITYTYSITDAEQWFSNASGSLKLSAESDTIITINGNVTDIAGSNAIQLIVEPVNHEEDAKTISLNAYTYPLAVAPEVLVSEFDISKIYPNPFNAGLQLDFMLTNFGSVELNVIDVKGRIVLTRQFNSLTSGEHSIVLNASDWASGLYLLKLSSEGMVKTRKAILIK